MVLVSLFVRFSPLWAERLRGAEDQNSRVSHPLQVMQSGVAKVN
ncbi:hypothetical protein N836_15960 [Leptolyngbya sp. Heron Island J]|nr:hypothetical protein N836_15960 [Leptolyngbya sp. Heron Island J]